MLILRILEVLHLHKKERLPGAVYERNYVYNFHYHLVWATKYRKALFTTEALVNEMKGILNELADFKEIRIESMEVMPDHIHLLLSFKPKHAPSSIVKYLKGHSAKLFFSKPSRD